MKTSVLKIITILSLLCLVGTCYAQVPATPGAISGLTTVCSNTTQTYSVAPVAGALFYNWSLPSGWTGSSSSNSITLQVGPGTGTISVNAGNVSGNSANTSITVVVKASPNLSLQPAGPIHICPDAAPISIQSTIDTAYTYQWYFNGWPILSATHADYSVITPGSYHVFISAQNGCADSSQALQLIVDAAPAKPSISVSGPQAFCEGGEVTINTTLNSGILWSTGANSQQIYVTETGTYFVNAVGSNGCQTPSDTVQINVWSKATADAGRDTFLFKGESITLNGTVYMNALWTPGASLNDSTIANPVASPLQATVYALLATTDKGCTARDTVLVNVLPAPFLAPPAAFTPNGDGNHDTWVIKNSEHAHAYRLQIFDRYGAKVFLWQGDVYTPWDATFQGKELPDADYYYTLEYTQTDGVNQAIQGAVTIIR